jgi:D-glycero-alpha-D-manno-heptose-7-phosphate kinase
MEITKLIIAKSPLRVSLFGGGSDFQNYFNENYGCVVGGSINLFVYVSVLELAGEAKEKYRFTYRITESVETICEFKHLAFKEILKSLNWKTPINVSTLSDIPGNSGLGSSSAFSVAALSALYNLLGKSIPNYKIAELAVQVEEELLGNRTGWQDQFHSSIGGFRAYTFTNSGVQISDPLLTRAQLNFLETCTLLVSTGVRRNSGKVQALGENIGKGKPSNLKLKKLADQAIRIRDLNLINFDNAKLLEILSEELLLNWTIKSGIIKKETPIIVEEIINLGIKSGTISHKLCGAGGGGYLLFFFRPDEKSKIVKNFQDSGYKVRSFKFIENGVEVLRF